MFKPAKIETRRGRIPVSEEARREARAGMGGEQTALAAGTAAVAVAPTPVELAVAPPEPPVEATTAPAPVSRPRAAKAAPAPVAAVVADQEHSVKLSKSVVHEIKLTLALLQGGTDNPTNIKQYLEMAHRLLDAQLRKSGKLPTVNR
ncbi:hypothetical protein ACFQT0_29505 [Hymenobacter humi]|uniref:Uncharacterized protein n=1 Tax=Hymenobacter humi TaxID=1411620 RepID=A0ABW2UCB3_9BACT